MKSNSTNNIGAILIVICGTVWLISTIASYLTGHSKDSATSQASSTYQSPNTPTPVQKPITTPNQTPTNAVSSEQPYNLCKVRIENSYEGSDKTGGYKARMDSAARTLTLSYIENPKEVIVLTKQEGGLTKFQLFRDNALEATKTFYRRPDLESANQYVYTTRTEEVKITIDYN